ncbi:MAG: hypothetical protein IJJ42_07120 [Clostridia bacterium]|nr:hypothetical protein [Clostridia bacterium]
MKRIIKMTAVLLGFCFLLLAQHACSAEGTPSFRRPGDALTWIAENQPEALDLGKTKFGPADLLKIRQALPAGAAFAFEAEFRGAAYTQDTVSFNANGNKKQISREELLALIQLMPELRELDVSGHRELSNKIMPDIVDQYPDIRFAWLIQLPYGHSLSSAFTAYSTMNNLDAKRFTEKSLDIMKYAPDIRALDMGHNDIKDISFLKYMPGIELLILADNEIEDLTPLAELTHLRYCEIFMNRFSDLSPLSRCTELLDLNIVRTNVTSLDGLEGCTKLERLWAPQRKQLDEASIERFISAHPDCQIAYGTGNATGEGWRDHWRYRHYVSCFKKHTWIPFEEAGQENR